MWGCARVKKKTPHWDIKLWFECSLQSLHHDGDKMSCQSKILAGHCSSPAQSAWESKAHTLILLHKHTHSYTTGHLLSLSGLVAVDEYKKDESLIWGSAGAHYRTAHVRDYFLWQQLKTQIEHGILSWIWLPAACLPLTRQLSGVWLWPLDVKTTTPRTLCWPLSRSVSSCSLKYYGHSEYKSIVINCQYDKYSDI